MMKSYPEFYNKRMKYAQEPAESANTSISSIDESSLDHQSASPSSPAISTPSQLPLASITNKFSSKPLDLAVAYSNIASGNSMPQQTYYQGQNYENFANLHLNAFNSYATHHQTNAQLLQQQSYYGNQLQQANNLSRLNTNHRNSTGSSADSSSVSLNSPTSINDENSPMQSNLVQSTQHLLQQQAQQSLQSQARYNGSYTSSALAQKSSNELIGKVPNLVGLNSSLLKMSGDDSNMSDGALPLKKRRPVPVENKDMTYWEKRRKNNESAKRSRDSKRYKECEITRKAYELEQLNIRLSTEVSLLRSENERLKAMLFCQNSNNNNNHLN